MGGEKHEREGQDNALLQQYKEYSIPLRHMLSTLGTQEKRSREALVRLSPRLYRSVGFPVEE